MKNFIVIGTLFCLPIAGNCFSWLKKQSERLCCNLARWLTQISRPVCMSKFLVHCSCT